MSLFEIAEAAVDPWKNSTFYSMIPTSFIICLIFPALLIVAFLLSGVASSYRNGINIVGTIASGLAAISLFGFIISALGLACLCLLHTFVVILHYFPVFPWNFSIAPLFIIFGFLLYNLRQYLPFVYGFVELMIGLISVQASSAIRGDNFSVKILGVMAGLYIIVRGLDNMNKKVPKKLELFWSYINLKGEHAVFYLCLSIFALAIIATLYTLIRIFIF